MRCNTALLIHEAVRTGIGVAHLAAFGADHAPGLTRLRPPDPVLNLDLWLLVHPDQRGSARVRAFVAHLTSEIEALRDLIEGRSALKP